MDTAIIPAHVGHPDAPPADAGPLLRALLDAALAAGPDATIALPPGDYHLWPETAAVRELYVSNTVGSDPHHRDKRIGLLIEGARGLTIDAHGARLVVHGKQTALAIVDSADVRIRGLEIDWETPTVIDVTVADGGHLPDGRTWRALTVPRGTRWRIADGSHVEWISEESPFTGELYWQDRDARGYSQAHDSRTGRTWRTRCPLFDDVASIERDGDRILVTHASPVPVDDIGLTYQLRDPTRDHPGMLALESARVALEDVDVRFLHGFGFVAQNGDGLTLERVRFQPREDRVTAGAADFLQCSGMRGRIRIADCVFDGPHDDPINVHGTYLLATAAAAADVALAYRHPETAGFPQHGVGDEVAFVRWDTLETLHTAIVAAADGPSGRDHAAPLETLSIRVDPAPPAGVADAIARGEIAVENLTRTPSVEITGSVFRHVPTRAILVTTRRPVRIEGCDFSAIEMPCIQIAADASEWWESGPVTDVRIAGNRFAGVTVGVLQVAPGIRDGAAPVHGTVVLEGNTLELEAPLLAEVRGLRRLEARGNVVTGHPMSVIEADAFVDIAWESPHPDSPVPTVVPPGGPG